MVIIVWLLRCVWGWSVFLSGWLRGARTTDLVGSLGSRPQGANAKGAGGAWDGADMLAIMIEIAATSIKVLASDLFDQMVLSSDGEGGR